VLNGAKKNPELSATKQRKIHPQKRFSLFCCVKKYEIINTV